MKKVIVVVFLSTFIFMLKNIEFSKSQKGNHISESPKKTFRKIASMNENYSIGKIYFCKGSFFVNRVKEDCQGKMNKDVYENDLIETNIRSFVKIKMVDKTNIMLGPKTRFNIDEYSVVNNNEKNITLSLIKGFIHTHFREKIKKGKAIIKTRNASMGVRGTEFITEFDGDKTRIFLFHGLVHVKTGVKNEEFFINPNELVEINKSFIFEKNNLNEKWVDEIEENLKKEEFIPELKDDFIKYQVVVSEGSINPLNTGKTQNNILKNTSKEELVSQILKKNNAKNSNVKKQIQTFLEKSYSDNKNRIVLDLDNSETSENLKIKLKEYSKEKINNRKKYVSDLNKRGIVYPLIKPNDEVVYFRDNPDALKEIPRDKNGNIIGIRVDEDLKPIQTEAILLDEDLTTHGEKIRVIDEDGSVKSLDLLTEDNRLITLPNIEVEDKSLILNNEGEFETLENQKELENDSSPSENINESLNVLDNEFNEITDVNSELENNRDGTVDNLIRK